MTTEKAQKSMASVKDYLEMLARATDEAFLTEAMQNYLEFASRFHKYSENNVFLILLQCPHATMVRGYKQWQEMGRQVRKGEHAIHILAPITKRTGTKVSKRTGEEEPYYICVGFRGTVVFDVSQTDGDPLPEPPDWKSLEKQAELEQKLIAFAESENISVAVTELPGNTQGVSRKGTIAVIETAGTKTLIHEIAHELMHYESYLDSATRELEAEAVAYVVCKHFGFNNLQSPNYLALHGATGDEIKDKADRILQTASTIIDAVE